MRASLALGVLAAIALAGGIAGPAAAAPIPDADSGSFAPFEGTIATPKPAFAPDPPRHPFMAPNGQSNIHNDAYMTDTNQGPGPLGRNTETTSGFLEGVCGSITFDRKGRIVSVCVGVEGPKLVRLDPRTLDTLSIMPLPNRQPGGITPNLFNDFAGGGYFYLDNEERAVIPTTTRHIYVVGPSGDTGFALQRDYDTSTVLGAGDKIISALPDYSGRIWFASVAGVVGTVDPKTGSIKVKALGEDISNSFSVDDTGGVYIVTRKALYRLEADGSGTPVVTWREEYDNSGIAKPGQVHAGSGTTPTLMGSDLVSITDNADPMQIVVYKRARAVTGSRQVCEHAVFTKGRSATDQSLIGTRSSMVVENNYGYTGPTSTNNGAVTAPGLERVDVDRESGRCTTVWKNQEIAPSVVPKLSLSNGLVYTYTKTDNQDDPWYLTALDFETGTTIYKRFVGTGVGFNNNFAAVALGPDGTAYVGALGGAALVRDAVPPPTARVAAPSLRIRVSLRPRSGRHRGIVFGPDARLIERVEFFLGSRRTDIPDAKPPFNRRVGPTALVRGRRYSLRALVRLRDGRSVTLRKPFTHPLRRR